MQSIYRIANTAYKDKVPEISGYNNVILSDSNKFGIDCSFIIEKLPISNVIWSRIIYLKLFIPWIAKEDRVVFMDCDTDVLGDISSLWTMQLKGPCAIKRNEQWLTSLVNSGVLVFDCVKWRECFDINVVMELCRMTLTTNIRGIFTCDEHVFEMLMLMHEFDKLDDRFNETGIVKPDTVIKHNLWTSQKLDKVKVGTR